MLNASETILLGLTDPLAGTSQMRDCLAAMRDLDAEWEIIALAASQRVLPVLVNRIDSQGMLEGFSSTAQRTMKAVAAGTALKNRHFVENAAIVCRALEDEGIRCAVLKGPAAEIICYGAIGTRVYGDIDILCERRSSASVARVLADLGYVQGDLHAGQLLPADRRDVMLHELNTHESFPYRKFTDAGDLIELDINFEFQWRGVSRAPSAEEVTRSLESVSTVSFKEFHFPTLDAPDMFASLCRHAASEANLFLFDEAWQRNRCDELLGRYLDIFMAALALVDKATNSLPMQHEWVCESTWKLLQLYPSARSIDWLAAIADQFVGEESSFTSPEGVQIPWDTPFEQRLLRPIERVNSVRRGLQQRGTS